MGTGPLGKAKLLEDNIEVKILSARIPSLAASGTRSSELISASLTFPHAT